MTSITPSSAAELLARYGITPSRALGQNFVVDPNTVRRIARLAGVGPGDHVVEVGAGLGSLTLALAETGAAVTAVEVDRRLLEVLAETLAGTDVRVVGGDAMQLDWQSVLGDQTWVLVANLPYNVATPLVLDLLEDVPAIGRMLVMVQREVGERLAAAPGEPACGIPSVRLSYWATAKIVGRVSPEVFVPRPRVESVLVEVERRASPAIAADPDRLFTLVRAGFGQRRKMLRRCLAGLVDAETFAAAGVAPEARAEQLSLDDWDRLAASGVVTAGPLADLRVIDCSTVIAGPGCARYLADFGADVIKVEHPDGDGVRRMGFLHPDGDSLMWKLVSRGKRTIALDFKDPDGLAAMRKLCCTADVLVENFRPGTFERLGLAPADLLADNPKLVVVRVTGFGQDGPYARRPGFATVAEAMSGFAALNGEPEGGPLLPPIALTDEVTALVAAFATMVAVHSGVGQVIDVNLLESLFQIMGPLISAHHTLGYAQPRLGSGIPYSVPRGTYQCAGGEWVAISTSAETVARRVMELIGAGDDARFATVEGRVAHRAEVDRLVAAWVGERTQADVLAAFEAAEAAIGPVLDMAGIADDPHYRERGTIVDVDGVLMQGLVARLSATPGAIRWAGRARGADTDEVLGELE